MASDTDWAQLEFMEFEVLQDVWSWTKSGSKLAGESGLIVVQAVPDFYGYMRDTFPMSGDRKARRATMRLKKVVDKFTGIKNDFERMPREIMNIYQDEIMAARRKGKKKIDLTQ
jgi:hypothetical protein